MALISPHNIAVYDSRPFFEKALLFGVQEGILEQAKLDTICVDAPKGMVQIARYFGNEFLRPEIEKAKDRIINLVSLHLQSSTGGDLRQAAQLLREHSFMSRSKAGADMLKALIAMPQNSHFGMNEHGGFTDAHIPLLAKWSLCSLADYQAELATRSQVAQVIDAALWLADALGLDADALEEAGKDAEAVIRTALLVLAVKGKNMPDWVAFEGLVTALRSKYAKAPGNWTLALPKNLPADYRAVVESVRQSISADAAKILDASLPIRKLFDQTPAFMGRYFWLEDALSEVDHFERSVSAAWAKATGGHIDDSSLLTLFLCIAAEAPAKTLLTEKQAKSLVRKIRKSGVQPELANQYIHSHAPEQDRDDYIRLWADFMADAQPTLQSDFDYQLHDALALLGRDCNVTA